MAIFAMLPWGEENLFRERVRGRMHHAFLGRREPSLESEDVVEYAMSPRKDEELFVEARKANTLSPFGKVNTLLGMQRYGQLCLLTEARMCL